jgi:cystathionine beta-lyase/cystathionine gamma-synthase
MTPGEAASSREREPKPDTACARPANEVASSTKPVVPPLQLSSVYEIDGLDQVDALYEKRASGFIYARDGHPNASQLAAKIAALEGAESAVIGGSGMAAESALFLALLDGSGQVALSDGLYGRTVTLVTKELSRFGITHRTFDATRPETLREAITPSARLAFVETLSNPLLRLADIARLAEICHEARIPLVVDNTFAPLICRPLAMGVDAVTHSLTKLVGGHSDVTLGALAGGASLIERAGAVASTFGLSANPFDCWLAMRGLATLAVRSRQACSSALTLAEKLSVHSRVRAVHYPGLASHPDYARAASALEGGFGTIVTIDLGGRSEADKFIRALHHIPFAPSLADVSTTLSHPATTSHRGQTAEQWARQGITPGLVRLSIGLEDPTDIWADVAQALDAI